MQITDLLQLAAVHVHEGSMATSAALCLEDARDEYEDGRFRSARRMALKSLAFSVGVFHPDYVRADRQCEVPL